MAKFGIIALLSRSRSWNCPPHVAFLYTLLLSKCEIVLRSPNTYPFQPILVIIQVVLMLRTSYRGRDLDEGLWTAFVNFITLTVFVLFITAIHVFSMLIVLMRFQPFIDYTDRRKQEKRQVLAEFQEEQQVTPLKRLERLVGGVVSNNRQLSPNKRFYIQNLRNARHKPMYQLGQPYPITRGGVSFRVQELERPPTAIIPNTPNRVTFAPQSNTYYYAPSVREQIVPSFQPTTTNNPLRPTTTRQSKSFIV